MCYPDVHVSYGCGEHLSAIRTGDCCPVVALFAKGKTNICPSTSAVRISTVEHGPRSRSTYC